jgi:hypothetical protein
MKRKKGALLPGSINLILIEPKFSALLFDQKEF